MRALLKWVDIPPVWLVAAILAAAAQARYVPLGLAFDGPIVGPIADLLGGVLVGGGLVLMALAVWEMRRMKTTVIPHRDAEHLVQSRIFKRSRNPIYLGDLLILAGMILRLDAVLALPLIPVFLWIIEKRFVIPEENRLRKKFRADFARYCEKTRRWI